jgi:hypothetical protein
MWIVDEDRVDAHSFRAFHIDLGTDLRTVTAASWLLSRLKVTYLRVPVPFRTSLEPW